MSYTAIGGGVNLASRLEQACTPGRILVSYAVYTHTRDNHPYAPLVSRELKGFAREVRTAELDPTARP